MFIQFVRKLKKWKWQLRERKRESEENVRER